MAFRSLQIFRSMAERDGIAAAVGAALAHVGSKIGLRKALKDLDLDARFDKAHGLDTSEVVDVEELGLGEALSNHAVEYNPTQAHEFATAMKRLNIDHQSYQFIDYGSGKGKVLLLAAEYPFMGIQGIEASEAMHSIACTNIAKFPLDRLKCPNIQSICIDAAKFIPAPQPTVAYMFNPFSDVVLRKALSNLHNALSTTDEPSYLIYRNPKHHSVVLESGVFEHLENVVGERIAIYRSQPKEHA